MCIVLCCGLHCTVQYSRYQGVKRIDWDIGIILYDIMYWILRILYQFVWYIYCSLYPAIGWFWQRELFSNLQIRMLGEGDSFPGIQYNRLLSKHSSSFTTLLSNKNKNTYWSLGYNDFDVFFKENDRGSQVYRCKKLF